jgi:hypothetical protein
MCLSDLPQEPFDLKGFGVPVNGVAFVRLEIWTEDDVVLLAVFGDPYIGPMKALTVDTKRDHTECDRYCLVTLRASTSTEERLVGVRAKTTGHPHLAVVESPCARPDRWVLQLAAPLFSQQNGRNRPKRNGHSVATKSATGLSLWRATVSRRLTWKNGKEN